MESWKGELLLSNGNSVADIHIISQENIASSKLPSESKLQFISIVEVSQVPLYLSVGPSCLVWTDNQNTSAWFSDYLLREPELPTTQPGSGDLSWFQCSNQSYAGILAEVSPQSCFASDADVSEVLFYGRLDRCNEDNDGIAQLHVYALPLSSRLLRHLPTTLSPPLSPSLDGQEEASQFLSAEVNEALVSSIGLENKHLPDIFETASEVRRKAKGRGGAGIAAAAAGQSQINLLVGQKKPKTGPALGNAKRNKTLVIDTKVDSGSQGSSPLLSNEGKKGHAYSPSAASDFRQHGRKLSSLSRVTSFTAREDEGESTIEQQNKAAISRLVMAGMRLYGLQSRKKTDRSQSSTVVLDEISLGAMSQEDEYKLIYHQTYKGAVFAFRHQIATKALHLQTDRLRDTVDSLLALFCSDISYG